MKPLPIRRTPPKQPPKRQPADQEKTQQDGRLERFARKIDPSGREVDERDLKDPGNMTPESLPADNRS